MLDERHPVAGRNEPRQNLLDQRRLPASRPPREPEDTHCPGTIHPDILATVAKAPRSTPQAREAKLTANAPRNPTVSPSTPHWPVAAPAAAPGSEIEGVIERVISDVPPPRTERASDAARAAERVAREAAQKAAVLSGSLALPPGPFGMLTVLPDLFLIWKVQRQMVADIFALHGREAELTRSHMLYCLFRHMASQVARDVVVRAGQRVIVQQLSAGTLAALLRAVGVSVTQRVAGVAASRWVPIAGAAAIGAYAYWDTLQVARSARRLLEAPAAAG
jgi:hypothetical protein